MAKDITWEAECTTRATSDGKRTTTVQVARREGGSYVAATLFSNPIPLASAVALVQALLKLDEVANELDRPGALDVQRDDR